MPRPQCVVFQPFAEPYNSYYDRIFKPAIEQGGYKPFRVDKEPTVDFPVQELQAALREAKVFFADISEPRESVWFEVGYGFALDFRFCLVCRSQTPLPFNIRHLSVIYYDDASSEGLNILGQRIVSRMAAIYNDRAQIARAIGIDDAQIGSFRELSLAKIEDIYLVHALINSGHHAGVAHQRDVERYLRNFGLEPLDIAYASNRLRARGFTEEATQVDQRGQVIPAFSLTQAAYDYISNNLSILRDLARSVESSISREDEK